MHSLEGNVNKKGFTNFARKYSREWLSVTHVARHVLPEIMDGMMFMILLVKISTENLLDQ